MQITKNRIIGALVVLLLIAAVWGQMKNGQNKKLIRENETLQAQLKSGKEDAASCSSLRTELSKEREAKQQAADQLNTVQKKKTAAETKTAELEAALAALQQEKEGALNALEAMKKSLSGEQQLQQNRIEELQQQISQQQTVLEEQGQKLDSAAKVIEREQQQVKSCGERVAELDELEAASQQLEEERNKVLAEAETMRAQVIGLEKIVEERSASLANADKELANCKLNNEILIGQIAQVKQEPVKKPLKSKAEQQMPVMPQQKPVLQQSVPQQQLD
ncbi:hypothetical protein [Candidatus Electronema sp. TJ]|uniref:hypothetical protein n=1 Tax=Candidatus Electronema sp. TJ TaxID=3401573 RepID=UPI003AA93FE3